MVVEPDPAGAVEADHAAETRAGVGAGVDPAGGVEGHVAVERVVLRGVGDAVPLPRPGRRVAPGGPAHAAGPDDPIGVDRQVVGPVDVAPVAQAGPGRAIELPDLAVAVGEGPHRSEGGQHPPTAAGRHGHADPGAVGAPAVEHGVESVGEHPVHPHVAGRVHALVAWEVPRAAGCRAERGPRLRCAVEALGGADRAGPVGGPEVVPAGGLGLDGKALGLVEPEVRPGLCGGIEAHEPAEAPDGRVAAGPDGAVGGDLDVGDPPAGPGGVAGVVVLERGGPDGRVEDEHAAPGAHPEVPLGVGCDVADAGGPSVLGVPDLRVVDVGDVDPAVLRLDELGEPALFKPGVIPPDPGVVVGPDPDRVAVVALDAGVAGAVVAPGVLGLGEGRRGHQAPGRHGQSGEFQNRSHGIASCGADDWSSTGKVGRCHRNDTQ